MLSDPRFVITSGSFMRPPGLPDEYQPYLRTMSEMDGPEHSRLRRLVAPSFTPRRAADFRPRIQAIVDSLLDNLTGEVDLLETFARPLPIEVICELVGIPESDRPRWRSCGAAIAAGIGTDFFEAIPGIVDGAKAAVALRRAEPADDLLTDLIRQLDDGDRLDDTELVTMIWLLVLAGQTPTNFIANAVEALLTHPDQWALLRENPSLMPGAVEELMRWCTPQLLTVPRFPTEDVEISGTLVRKGEPTSAAIVSVNRDASAFSDPDRLDVTRPVTARGQLGFSHGPHYCLGASFARVETEIALTTLISRFPRLALGVAAADLVRAADGGTWRLAALPVMFG
ncbi:cytochrome P450 [Fodinicola feengrottensis]|uniref:Cytochrome P450 n=2 Tax=Fodinicola feengrottensis TaxID=435914 RepID=A0ABP4TIK7_9ACTN